MQGTITHSVQNTCPHGTLLALFEFSKHNGHSYDLVSSGFFPLPLPLPLAPAPAFVVEPFDTSIVESGQLGIWFGGGGRGGSWGSGIDIILGRDGGMGGSSKGFEW